MESIIEWLTTKTDHEDDETDTDDPTRCMAALQLGFNMAMGNWWEDSDSIIDTLIALLSNRDRRILLLAAIYLGLVKEIYGEDYDRIGSVKRAIDPINDLAKRTSDKNLGIAFGITNAVLGDLSAAKWMAQQMAVVSQPSEEDFIKYNRLILIQQLAKGWK
jgi:hypothetical protein